MTALTSSQRFPSILQLKCLVAISGLFLGRSVTAETLIEDNFSNASSLSDWTLQNIGESTITVVEGKSGNMDGYLQTLDNDTTNVPIARRGFAPTETGYIDLRMSGTKWAGSGAMSLYSETGTLFNISLTTTNDAVKASIDTFASAPIREDEIFSDPLDLGSETPSFPFGRDIRITWSDGLVQLYMVGIDGTIHQSSDKAFVTGSTPNAIGLSSGYSSATGRSGFFDFVKVSSGLPTTGLGTSISALPLVEGFASASSLTKFELAGTADHTVAVSETSERGMDGFFQLADLVSGSRPSATVQFTPATEGYIRAKLSTEGGYHEILTLSSDSGDVYRVGSKTENDKILIYVNDENTPVLSEPLVSGETPTTALARTLTLVWNTSGTANIYWEKRGGDVLFSPSVSALNSGGINAVKLSAGTTGSVGGKLNIDSLTIDSTPPSTGIGSVNLALPIEASFDQSIDLEGWVSTGTVNLPQNAQGTPNGELILVDEQPNGISQISRTFTPAEFGFFAVELKATQGDQEILRLNSESGTQYSITVRVDSSGYQFGLNGDISPSLTSAFNSGETLASHTPRTVQLNWDGSAATITLRDQFGGMASLSDVAAKVAGTPATFEILAGNLTSTGHSLTLSSVEVQRSSRVWNSYVEAWTNGSDLPLANYANAGYKYGQSEIPEVHQLGLSIFNVTQYGAIPNDEVSDRAAIVAAIAAAEANKGGIVFFPPGVFLVNEVAGATNSQKIFIRGSNIILKGSGSGPNGTTLHMREHLLPTNLSQAWSTPNLFNFVGTSSAGAGSSVSAEATKLGSRDLTLADASPFSVGDYIRIYRRDTAWNDQFLEGLTPRDDWGTIKTQGVQVREFNQISAIEGNTLKLAAPITGSFPTGMSVTKRGFGRHMGVEDLHFKGNFHEEFAHHGNNWNASTMQSKYGSEQLYAAYMDGGFSAFSFDSVTDSWCRRVRITDVNGGVSFRFSTSSSILETTIDGNAGHSVVSFALGSHNLIGNSQDITPLGYLNGHHGPSMSQGECGSVIWRWNTSKGSAFDFHASFPRANLVDHYEGWGWDGSGGAASNLPNILDELTFWNHTVTGPWDSALDFWNFDGVYSGSSRAVKPNFIGLKSVYSVEAKLDTMGHVESLDGLIYPASLYEAQMELEHGTVPTWIADSQVRFENLKALIYGNAPALLPQYNLNLTVPVGGRLVSNLSNGNHQYLSMGTVSLVVEAGYTFLGWEGDLGGKETDTLITLSKNLSARAIIVPEGQSKLANLSTRAQVGAAENVLISGFVIAGSGTKTLLIRAVGPTLGAAPYNLPGTLVEPNIVVYKGQSKLTEYSKWGDFIDQRALAAASTKVGAFPLNSGSADSAAIRVFEPGPYTIHVKGAGEQTGIVLLELYDADAADSIAQLVNLSSRMFIGSGDAVAIPGFVVSGAQPKRVLIRAVGPILGTLGVSGVLGDPKFTVFKGSAEIGGNDNWNDSSSQSSIVDVSATAGAFPLDSGSKDAAEIFLLEPGNYTVVVSGVENTTGVALVEVYSLDQ